MIDMLQAQVADRCPHIYNIQKTTYKLAVRVIGEKQIPCVSNQGGRGLGQARWAKSQAVAV